MSSKGGVLRSAMAYPVPCCRLRAQSIDPKKLAKRAHGASRDANRTVSSSVDAGDVIQLKPIVFSAPAALHGSHTCGAAHAASACSAVSWIAHMRCSPCSQHMQRSDMDHTHAMQPMRPVHAAQRGCAEGIRLGAHCRASLPGGRAGWSLRRSTRRSWATASA